MAPHDRHALGSARDQIDMDLPLSLLIGLLHQPLGILLKVSRAREKRIHRFLEGHEELVGRFVSHGCDVLVVDDLITHGSQARQMGQTRIVGSRVLTTANTTRQWKYLRTDKFQSGQELNIH